MANLGYDHSLSLGDINSGVLQANRQIAIDNIASATKFQNSVNKSSDDTFSKAKDQLTNLVGEQIATKGKSIKRTLKGAKQLGTAVKELTDSLPGVAAVSEAELGNFKNPLESGGPEFNIPDDGVTAKDITSAASQGYILEPGIAKSVEKTGTEIAGNTRDMTSLDLNIDKTGLGDIAGAGLQVLSGGLDLASDIKAGKVTGDNFLERAGNVLDIGAGALEVGGIAADLTGIGAAGGLIANAVGGVVGLAGGVLDLAGDVEEALDPGTPKAKAPTKTAPLAVLASGSTGAEVKQNIQTPGQ